MKLIAVLLALALLAPTRPPSPDFGGDPPQSVVDDLRLLWRVLVG